MLFCLKRCVIFLAGICVFFYPDYAAARQTVVIGSLGLGYDYWERTYDEDVADGQVVDEDEGDRREYGAWPEIELRSLGIHDIVTLRYAPVLRYDELDETTDVDHYLDLTAERAVTKKWNISISELYVLSNDPGRYDSPFDTLGGLEAEEADTDVAETEQPPDEITQNLGRSRFWTNDLILGTTYTYAEDSDFGLGYSFRVLRDDSDDDQPGPGYDEYDRHEFSARLGHRFNAYWRSSLNLEYVKGLYDDIEPAAEEIEDVSSLSQDLEEYRATVRADYDQSVKDSFPLIYNYIGTKYEGLRSDVHVHELTAGWEHAYDERTRLTIGGGPSYADDEELDGSWGYNAYLDFTRIYQHGNIGILVDKRYDTRNFTGSGDTGLTDVTSARVDATYQFTPDLSTTIFGQYRYEDIVNPQGEYFLSALGENDPAQQESIDDVSYTRDSYTAGASLTYTFLRWFAATLRYSYYQQEGDLFRDSYDDHRVMFLVTASKELWR